MAVTTMLLTPGNEAVALVLDGPRSDRLRVLKNPPFRPGFKQMARCTRIERAGYCYAIWNPTSYIIYQHKHEVSTDNFKGENVKNNEYTRVLCIIKVTPFIPLTDFRV